MNKGLVFLGFLMALIMGIVLFPSGASAAIVGALGFALVIGIIKLKVKDFETYNFLINVFLGALLIRVFLAALIYGFGLEGNFGPDALTYDAFGHGIVEHWWGGSPDPGIDFTKSGWGMPYLVALVYSFTGQSPLAAQVVSCILGAATAVLAFFTSKEIFNNNKVARYTAIFVSFFPAMIVWTAQLLKEGFIIFFLVLSVLAALHLLKKFSAGWVIHLLISLLALSGLRFYIFFMVVVAVFGGFILSSKSSAESLLSRFAACVLIAVALAYLGVWRISGDQIEKYGSLERVQVSREWASKAANSGVVKDDTDVTTATGAISALPIGLATLLLAPFPWQIGSLTQALTMPEMILWWASLPLLISGLSYTIKTRFKESVSILFFTLILSLAYSLYQGNLGTIYRQRAQIQVFLLLFIAVGFALKLEKRENAKILLKSRRLPQRIPLN